ncbi:MAG: hypothetical protein JSR28_07305 [Proteobacteria bacterium]|nr:hypothetical protein [Pseudomonadota bacterium]
MTDQSSINPGSVEAASALLRRSALAALGIAGLSIIGSLLVPTTRAMPLMTARLVFKQDLWLAVGLVGVAIMVLIASGRNAAPLRLNARSAAVVALAVVAVTYAGRYLVLENYDLVRDEQLVGFDAWIYGQGHLVWPIPEMWRDHVEALGTTFMYPVAHPVAWVSSYLPGNALLHAAVGSIADPGLTSPLLAGGSAWLLWSCARRIWPDDREAATVALLIMVLSGQFLVAAMTTWAMSAHLFFNLLWLRLFLNDRRGTDAVAILIGAFATGLHQPLFHPMFVAPFLGVLLAQRRWLRLAPFVLAYAAIGLFWLSWPHWIQPLVAGPASGAAAAASAGGGFLDRLSGALGSNTDNLTLTAANLLRFVTWGHLATLPLVFAAWPMIRRAALPAALAVGVALPIVVLAVILPWQGYGFGYRYLHPVLGNVALLAAYGWRNLESLLPRLRTAMLVASAGMVMVVLPMQFVLAHRFVDATATASRTIDASHADYAIIRIADGFGFGNIVYNSPDLSNRPIRLVADDIPDHARLAARICHAGVTVAMPANSFYRAGTIFFVAKPFDTADATLARLRVPYEAAGCRIVVLR